MSTSGDNLPRRKRYRSLDIIRGCAILSMIQAHLFLLSNTIGPMNTLATLLMPRFFFVMVAGTSFDLLVSSRMRNMVSSFDVRLEIFLRGGVLLSVDLLMLFIGSIVWPSLYSFSLYWGVFEAIAVGYLLGMVLPRSLLSKMWSIAFLLAAIFLLDTSSSSALLADSLKNLLPMLLFFQLGRVMYDLYYNDEDNTYSMLRRGRLIVPTVFFLLGYFIAGYHHLGLSNPGWIVNDSNELPSIMIVFGNIFLLYHIFAEIADRHGVRIILLHIVERIGRISFSIFFVHIAIIYLVRLSFTALGLAEILPLEPPLLNLVTLASFILIFYSLEKWWSARQYRYGFEWILRTVPDYVMRILTKWAALRRD
jgi:peptidoglycan/LPS O-acetylase OafA/YrhL